MFRYSSKAIMALVSGLALLGVCEAESLPAPTGPYAVGRFSYQLKGAVPKPAPGSPAKREFMVEVWYPAQPGAGGNPAPWIPADRLASEEKAFVGALLRRSSDPAAKDVSKVLTSVAVHAREGVAVAASPQRFPVLLLAAGSQQLASEYSAIVEDLASRGFVVAGYGPTTLGGGTWRADLTQILDQLADWNTTRGHILFGRLDLDHIGAFGHSFGASAVSSMAPCDKRLKAIVLIDGGGHPEDTRAIPILVLNSEGSEPGGKSSDDAKFAAVVRHEYLRWATPGLHVTLLGAVHMSFTDLAVIKAFAFPGDGQAFIDTTRAVLGEFFGQYLMGKHSDLLEKGSAKYPLAKVEAP